MKKYLFINLYDAGEQRNEEFIECLEKNKKVFDKIFVLSETYYPGIENIYHKGNASIDDITKEINSHDGEINVIANADVWFEELPDLSGMQKNVMYALTRYEDGTFFCRQDSADAWIFRGKVNLKDCNFRLGLRGTDNAIADRAKKCGYRVVNPSLDIKINHVHKTRFDNRMYAPQPYDMVVRPTTLNEHCILCFTSINPYDRIKEQSAAVASWRWFGGSYNDNVRIVSFNTRQEIELLKDNERFNGIIYVERDNAINGKYQRLSEMYKTIRNISADWYVLINSDIELRGKFTDTDRDCFILGVRNDDRDGKITPFPYGYDVFMMRRRHLELLKENTEYAIGLPYHDFYTPLKMIQCGERTHVDRKHFFHSWHETRYNMNIWKSMGEYSRTVGCFVKEEELNVSFFCTANKEYIENHLDNSL